MTRVLIVGATSAIAAATARRYAERGAQLFLVARDPARLDIVAADLTVRGATRVDTLAADLLDYDSHGALVAAALDACQTLDVVLIAHGVLPEQGAVEATPAAALEAMHVNLLSVMSIALTLRAPLLAQGSGTLAVISSVAGDRGRQSNYVYGAAKGGLDTFLQGLRNRLWAAGVNVVTIKPGFVATPMTRHLPATGLLWSQPEVIAAGIVRAVERRASVVYLPRYWALIMWVVRLIPEFIFKRLRL
ncbi:MAG: SDR family oxidoreductase [Gammaproteobacteria bacterium]|nr:SDR family oxidoreductase [Gammaproteobacteria bacterium]